MRRHILFLILVLLGATILWACGNYTSEPQASESEMVEEEMGLTPEPPSTVRHESLEAMQADDAQAMEALRNAIAQNDLAAAGDHIARIQHNNSWLRRRVQNATDEFLVLMEEVDLAVHKAMVAHATANAAQMSGPVDELDRACQRRFEGVQFN